MSSRKEQDLKRLRDLMREALYFTDNPRDESSSAAVATTTPTRRKLSPEMEQVVDRSINLLYDCMVAYGRVYHSVPHILDVCAPMARSRYPVPVIAALFHDIIYLSIDKQLSPEIQALIPEALVVPKASESSGGDGGRPSVTLSSWNGNWVLKMVDTVFGGIRPNNTNEYLSALVAVRATQSILSPSQLLRLTACIEATVPFRPNDPETGATPMEGLYQRVKEANEALPVSNDDSNGLSTTEQQQQLDPDSCVDNPKSSRRLAEAELISIVQDAALTANCDLGSFSTPDYYKFLDNSWSLLPEWHPALLQPSLDDLYKALLLLMQRYQDLNLDRIFPSFHNVPTEETMQQQKKQTASNIKATGEYGWTRLCATGTVLGALQAGVHVDESMAALGESNVFWTQFRKCSKRRLSKITRSSKHPEGWNLLVHDVLLEGRRTSFVWDGADDPWAAYLYVTIGPKTIFDFSTSVLAKEKDNSTSFDWLSHLSEVSMRLLIQILNDVLPNADFTKIRG